MHKIQFDAEKLKGTNALFLPHHSEVLVIERSHGFIVEYTELRRHYVLHLPGVEEPLIADDSAEIVSIEAEPGSPERLHLT